ncbi:MAG: Gfo/Idh/MocA family oxidoreductase [Clostridia bacterium]|nr:Gfo/Idh/MocA family oxidoreductase [Clostridia bacterium]
MKYALIGCGRVAPSHIKAAIENGLEIAAVCDLDASRMERLLENSGLSAEKIAAVRRFTDYTALFREVRPTLASIALPSGLHAACAFEGLKNDVNLIVEKPLAMSLADADEIIRLAKEHGVLVSACHQNRFNKAVQALRAALEAGRFGRLSNAAITVRWDRDEAYYAQDAWRGTWENDGGTLMNQCIHGIDLLCWMCGYEIESVYGQIRRQFHPYIQAEDLGTAVMTFKNGAVATVEGTVNVCGPDMEEHLTLLGEHGAVKLGGTSANTIEHWYFDDDPNDQKDGFHEPTRNVYGNGHTSLFADMAQAIRDGGQPYVTAEDGRRALEAVLAIYLSAKHGAPVKLPLPADAAGTNLEGFFDA